ncbi:MAG: DUF1800 domain-containing protein [Terriglobales bacterium]
MAPGVAVLALALASPAVAPAPLNSTQRVQQALRRLTWGIEPGQVEQVQKLGLDRWLNQQLHPDSVPENSQLLSVLKPLDSLPMSTAELMANYPPPQAINQMASGRRPLPADPHLRYVVESEIEQLRVRRDAKAAAAGAQPGRGNGAGRAMPLVMNAPPLDRLLSPEQITAIEKGPPQRRAAAFAALPAATRQQALPALPRAVARPLAAWLPLAEARQIAYYLQPQQVTTMDLESGKLLNAIYSSRQLQDVLTDFWFNHFNVYIRKGPERDLLAPYLRDAIRPHVLGSFHDLLLATAESPAMLFFLDNWQSVDPQVNKRGINENYGRELMELHTLGVNGGYTQQDVIAVAHCFTGWTIRQPFGQASFFYNDRLHDHAAQVVLGTRIPAGGGMNDGLKVLDMLASSPATAHHIAFELAQRFVADDPPPALVNRMAATFLKTHGDLRKVMETMIHSPEFFAPAYYDNKVRSPLEMVVAAVRATGADVINPMGLNQELNQMGEPLFAKEPPTGYRNTGDQWASSSGLLDRMKFASRLANGQLPGVQVNLAPLAQDPALLLSQISALTRAAIAKDTAGDTNLQTRLRQTAALTLGSPDFQRR